MHTGRSLTICLGGVCLIPEGCLIPEKGCLIPGVVVSAPGRVGVSALGVSAPGGVAVFACNYTQSEIQNVLNILTNNSQFPQLAVNDSKTICL